jgi:hypothetical protein
VSQSLIKRIKYKLPFRVSRDGKAVASYRFGFWSGHSGPDLIYQSEGVVGFLRNNGTDWDPPELIPKELAPPLPIDDRLHLIDFDAVPAEAVGQAEVEFTDELGVTRIVWLFSMVLGYSRLIWARFVVHQDLQSVLRCHIAALEAFGGAPCEILYDRMKTAVIGEDADGLVIYNRALLDLARHYGFQPRACRPYRPKTKGKVERPLLGSPSGSTVTIGSTPTTR